MPKGKVLSIQSYVVSSYVGGKGVTLILQVGFFCLKIYLTTGLSIPATAVFGA